MERNVELAAVGEKKIESRNEKQKFKSGISCHPIESKDSQDIPFHFSDPQVLVDNRIKIDAAYLLPLEVLAAAPG